MQSKFPSIYTLFATILISVILLGFASNPPNGNTGAPGDGLCTSCHGGGNPNLDGEVIIENFPSTIDPNTAYSITVRVTNPNGNAVKAGFQAVVLDASNSNIGDLTVSGSNPTTSTSGAREYVEHNPALNFPGGNEVTYDFTWTSPSGPNGEVITMYAAGNIANGNGSSTLDRIQTTNVTGTLQGGGAPLTVDIISSSNVSCNGGSNGSATALAMDGTPPYSYSWSSGATTPTANNLSAGVYTVIATDNVGATATDMVTITQPPALNTTVSSTVIDCINPTSTATANVSGGTMPYFYNWPGGGNGPSESGLTAGTYTLTVTDGNGCIDLETFTVVEDITPPIADAGSGQTLSCTNGTAVLNGSNSSSGPLISYFWQTFDGNILNGQGTTVIVVDQAGTYTLIVTDNNNGCTASDDAIVFPADPPVLSTSTINVFCNGGGNGSIDLTVNGGQAPFIYDWDDNSLDGIEDPTGLLAGQYCVTVTDVNDCSATICATISEPDLIIIIGTPVDATCFNNCDGSIDITVTGGIFPYTYAWDIPDTVEDPQGLCNGLYVVEVTDANGCTAEAAFIVSEPDAIVITLDNIENTCFGTCNGSIDISVTSGTLPYTYLWDDPAGQVTQDPTNLCPGTYTVIVTDDNGCTATASYEVSGFSEIVIDFTINEPSCNGSCDGSVFSSVTGGTSPYTYEWSNTTTTANIENICSGAYSLIVTDSNGCTASASTNVGEPDVLSISGTVSNVCNGACDGSIDISVSGGTEPYSFEWDTDPPQNTADINNLCAGTYTVIVTDDNGCTAISAFTVTEYDLIVIAYTIQEPSCIGSCDGSILPTISGGVPPYSFLWSNNSTNNDITDLCAGSYSLTVTDNVACTATAEMVVGEPDAIIITSNFTAPACQGDCNGTIDITVEGGTGAFSFEWNTGAMTEDLSGLCEGTYTVVVTDENGCTETHTVSFSSPSGLSIDFEIMDATCNGVCDGSIDLSVFGGTPPYTFEWDNGENVEDPQNLCAGINTVMVTDANGCSASISVSIAEPDAIDVSGTSSPATCGICNGSIDLTVSGGTGAYTYDWDNGLPNVEDPTNLCAGTYVVIIADANGCTATFSITVDTPSGLTISGIATNALCFGVCNGSINITASGGSSPYSYLWSGGLGTVEDPVNVCAGEYTVVVTDGDGCSVTASFTVGEPDELVATGNVQDPICFGECSGSILSSVVGGTAPYSYQWSNGSGEADIINLCAGTYDLLVTDANGCTAQITFTLNEPDPVNVTITGDLAFCEGETSVLDAGSGFSTYQWSDGSTNQTITVSIEGQYCVTVTDINSCTATDCVIVTVFDLPVLQMSSTSETTPGANDGTASVAATGGVMPYTYQWNDPATQTTPTATGLSPGDYCVIVTDNNGCTQEGCVTVDESGCNLSGSISANDVLCFGGNDGSATANVTGGTEPYSYDWSTGSGEMMIINLSAGTYSVVVTDANGCTLNLGTSITEPEPILISSTQTNVTCNGICDGTVDLTVTGGTPPYTYNWSGPCVGPNPVDICAGTFTVTITDANGCTVIHSVSITEPSAIVLSITTTAETAPGANDGTASASVSGGTTGYIYLWSNGETTQAIENLAPDNYCVTVTDANGCTESSCADVESSGCNLSGSISSVDVSCFGGNDGSATVNVSGGTEPYSYDWSTGSGEMMVINLLAGPYSVVVTDANGCTAIHLVTIIEPEPIELSLSSTSASAVGANDGTATATPTGGTEPYTYSWDDTSNQITQTAIGLTPGTYCVVVTDANACTATGCVTVNDFGCDMTLEISNLNITCFGTCEGAIDLTINNGSAPFSFFWSDGSIGDVEDPDGLCAGNYSVTVTDANQCTTTIAAFVNENPEITDILEYYFGSCSTACNGMIDATISGGTPPYMYAWNNGANTEDIDDLCEEDYVLTITDAFGCTGVFVPTIFTFPPPLEVTTEMTNVSCFGNCDGSISLSATGGLPPYDYDWENDDFDGQSMATDLCADIYSIIVTDSAGCSTAISVEVTEPDQIQINAITTDACFGLCDGTIDITVAGGSEPYTFIWAGDDPQMLCPGIHNLTITDVNACSDTLTYTINENPEITYSIDMISNEMDTQGDGAIEITINGGSAPYTYNWLMDNATVSIEEDPTDLSAGIYTCEITDGNGCIISTSEIVIDNIVAVYETAWEDQIKVFPNPLEGILYIDYNITVPVDVVLEVYDIRGVKVFTQHSKANNFENVQLGLGHLPNGVYTLRISTKERYVTFKIVKLAL